MENRKIFTDKHRKWIDGCGGVVKGKLTPGISKRYEKIGDILYRRDDVPKDVKELIQDMEMTLEHIRAYANFIADWQQ